jgi:hypothetical protein
VVSARTRGGAHRAGRSARPAARLARHMPLLLGALALSLWIVAVRRADFSAMDDAGLASVLGWPYLVALLAAIGAFVLELATVRRALVLIGVIGVAVVILFGTASAVEPVARLPDSWITAGFVQYISAHGQVLRYTDARFYWPGMFSMVALVDAAMGRSTALGLLDWAPLVFELLYLPPLLLIRRASGLGPAAGWMGVLVFYLGNWVEQDYFSPQAVDLLFLLVVVGVALHVWHPGPRPARPAQLAGRPGWRNAPRRGVAALVAARPRWLPPTAMVGRSTYGRATTTTVSVLIALLAAASVASHQLTPVAIFLALVALALTRRLPNLEILGLLPLLIFSWIVFAATDFWQYGHAALILGGVGHLGSSVSSGVSQRVTGTTIHRVITDLRILMAAAVLGLAVVGGLLRRRTSRSLELLAVVPFAILALQSYGGEATLRAYLYALPFAAFLAAEALCRLGGSGLTRARVAFGANGPLLASSTGPASRRRRLASGLRVVAVAVILATGASVLTLVRGGNDAYVAATPADRQAVTTVYAAAKRGEAIAELEPYVPWMDTGMGRWFFVTLKPVIRHGVMVSYGIDPRLPPTWVVLTTGEERYGEIVEGLEPGWERRAERTLVARDHYRVYWSRDGATVLEGPLTGAAIERLKQRILQLLRNAGQG